MLDPHDVWATRSYEGMISLPHWLTAFGWPLMMILAGVGILVSSYLSSSKTVVDVPVGLIVVGVIYFMLKLSGDDE